MLSNTKKRTFLLFSKNDFERFMSND